MKGKGSFLLMIMVCVLVALVMLPTTLVFVVGMLPTFVSFFVDKTRRRARSISVGAFNLAACSLFFLKLWGAERAMSMALDIISDPVAIIVMYMGAGAGYAIDMAVNMVVASVMYSKVEKRQWTIKKTQKDLVKRWGKEVAGDVPLDRHGFPVEEIYKKSLD